MILSLALTVALAVGLGLIIYLSVTSLPYLAVSPSTDPAFGRLNACVLEALKERTGYAVSRDLQNLAAWSPAELVVCAGDQPAKHYPLNGLTAGAWSTDRHLWFARTSADTGGTALWMLAEDGPRSMGELAVQALTATADGVVVLEPNGQLLALDHSGSVIGETQLPLSDVRSAALTSSRTGAHLALVTGHTLFAFTSKLKPLLAEAPCRVNNLWWRSSKASELIVTCEGDSPLSLSINVETGHADAVASVPRVPSTLSGPAGVWVTTCDVLPCSAAAPE